MSIRTSSTEGSIHIGLKKKVIEMLKRRNDIQSIDTEVMVNKRKGLRKSHVDVLAKKNDGINIYAEVKSDADLPGAILQLMLIDKKNKR